MKDRSNTTPLRGLGLDLVPIDTIMLALRRDANAACAWLTPTEIDTLGTRAESVETLAGRIAAKEAVVKSLGCGFDDEVAWQDITILADEYGAPRVRLTGGAAAAAKRIGVRCVLVTITHAGDYAAAAACAMA
ncbi:MAG: holo-ACP synthase [Planctomycetota bacterium]|nr:MAG: holo-ACP synthase [Planctomycetota bacterium]